MVRRRLRRLREERRWSAQQLADELHHYGVRTTRSTLANYENGLRADISFSEAVAACLALGQPLSALLWTDGPVRFGDSSFEPTELVERLSGTYGTVTVRLSGPPMDPRTTARVVSVEGPGLSFDPDAEWPLRAAPSEPPEPPKPKEEN